MSGAIHGQDLSDVWTPKIVGERLVEAIRWARYNAGRTGPAGMKAASIPYFPGPEEFGEGTEYGFKERADDDPPPPAKRYSPAKITAILDALEWSGRYVVGTNPTSAQVLALWLRCKVYRGNFDKAIEARGEMSRASAYRYRDRALGAIAVGLTKDGVTP